jgi:Sulfotransferase family
VDFVVGHPRSGTRFVCELLCAGEAGAAAHELLTTLEPRAVQACTDAYAGRVADDDVRAMVRAYRGQAPRIDCNWKLTWILGPLLAEFPAARVLHLARDPRENVRSCVNLDYYGALVHDARYQTDEVRNAWLLAMPDVRRADWSALDAFARNCAFWTETHRLAAEAERAGRYLRVRLEDLVADDGAARTVCAFLGVAPPGPDVLERVRAIRVNTKDDEKREVAALKPDVLPPAFDAWPAARRHALRALCGETARNLGYDL